VPPRQKRANGPISIFSGASTAVCQPTGFFTPAFSAHLDKYRFVCDFVFANTAKTLSPGL
jgi:hypothetical protein